MKHELLGKGVIHHPAGAQRFAFAEPAVEIRASSNAQTISVSQLKAALHIFRKVFGMIGFNAPETGSDQGGKRIKTVVLSGMGQHRLAAGRRDAADRLDRIGCGKKQGGDGGLALGPTLEQPAVKRPIKAVAAARIDQRLHNVLLAQIAARPGKTAHRLHRYRISSLGQLRDASGYGLVAGLADRAAEVFHRRPARLRELIGQQVKWAPVGLRAADFHGSKDG